MKVHLIIVQNSILQPPILLSILCLSFHVRIVSHIQHPCREWDLSHKIVYGDDGVVTHDFSLVLNPEKSVVKANLATIACHISRSSLG